MTGGIVRNIQIGIGSKTYRALDEQLKDRGRKSLISKFTLRALGWVIVCVSRERGV